METIEARRGGYVLVHIPGSWGDGVRLHLGRCPVTNEEYLRYVVATDAPRPRYWPKKGFGDPREPVVGVTWCDAMAYCQWAGLDLPTEAQWKHACAERSLLTGSRSQQRELLDRMAWYSESSGDRRQPVGTKQANHFGLHDMLGNVWEWCMDEITEDKRDFTAILRHLEDQGSSTETHRVLRGGSFRSVASVVIEGRLTAYDVQCGPDIGFRPVSIQRET